MLTKCEYWIPITVSIWTILQCLIHFWWLIYGRENLTCYAKEMEPKQQMFAYFEYFFGSECDSHINRNNVYNGTHFMNETNTEDITSKLMYFYISLDAAWIVSSVALLIGTIVRIKEQSAFLIYMPWIIIDLLTLSLDIFCAVSYLKQLSNKEVLIQESTFELPFAVIMALVSSRLGIIWLINLILIIFIARTALKAYKERYSEERSRYRRRNHSPEVSNERIHNWELYYDNKNATDDNELKTHLPWSYTQKGCKLPKKVVVVVEPYVLKTNDDRIIEQAESHF